MVAGATRAPGRRALPFAQDTLGRSCASAFMALLRGTGTGRALTSLPTCSRQQRVAVQQRTATLCRAETQETSSLNRRTFVLNSVNVGVLGALFAFGGEEPSNLGVQDFGSGQKGLSLCPSTPNCISTTSNEEAQDDHYVPPWTYNPIDGRGRKNPIKKDKAFDELVEVLSSEKPDNFTPTIVKQTDDYIHVEYESPFLGFKDDAEFWFPNDGKSQVQYRSASRLGEKDFDINRKRIKALRKALERKGWSTIGYA